MLAALATSDAATWAAVLVKALAYAATLLAAGTVLILLTLGTLRAQDRRFLRRLAVGCAVASALFTTLRLPAQTGMLLGDIWSGAWDLSLLQAVWQSPLGTSVTLRLVGLALILVVAVPGRIGNSVALLGTLLLSLSFAVRGHALGQPQIVLGTLVSLHVLCVAFWIGGFAPLLRALRVGSVEHAGALAHEFGGKAAWAVGILAASGAALLGFFGMISTAAMSSSYGQVLLIKLVAVCGLLCLAAVNKVLLTPALLARAPGAAGRLRRAIELEAVLAAFILVITAFLTTVAAPPR